MLLSYVTVYTTQVDVSFLGCSDQKALLVVCRQFCLLPDGNVAISSVAYFCVTTNNSDCSCVTAVLLSYVTVNAMQVELSFRLLRPENITFVVSRQFVVLPVANVATSSFSFSAIFLKSARYQMIYTQSAHCVTGTTVITYIIIQQAS